MSTHSAGFRRAAIVALLAVFAVIAACGGAAPPADAPEPGAAQADPAQADSAQAPEERRRPGTSITADEVRDVKVARAEELLAGRFAGVAVYRTAGGIAVRIRGGSSILGSNEPLYVIDGMTIQPGPGGALVGIAPEDIARIEVLKDIGSTAQYGMRGANGVVLITTRRGP